MSLKTTDRDLLRVLSTLPEKNKAQKSSMMSHIGIEKNNRDTETETNVFMNIVMPINQKQYNYIDKLDTTE